MGLHRRPAGQAGVRAAGRWALRATGLIVEA